ncbi:MAG TPA: histidine phosphatase family protein [Gammaproteobacteria bacterium]|nr:histidine phosphatase family protein [Gammaproteobacteria bacterium]
MREKEPSTRVIFVRHGMTDFPKDRIYCDDREDPVLNEQGRRQAEQAAHALAAVPVDHIFTSPMQRTLATARAIQHTNGAALVTDAALRERRFGVWDGLYFKEIEQQYPREYAEWKQNPALYNPRDGESIDALQRRVQAAITEFTERHPGKTLLVVSHVGPIRVGVCAAIGLPVEGYRQLTVDYCSLTRVDYGRRQNNLIYLNFGGLPLA